MKNTEMAKIANSNIEKLNIDVIPKLKHTKTGKPISKYTVEKYTTTAIQFNEFLEKTASPIDAKTIDSFLDSHGWISATRNNKRFAIQSILNAQIERTANGTLEANIKKAVFKEEMKNVKIHNVDKAVTRDEYLDQSQVNTVISQAKKEKDKLFVEFLFQTGCRISTALDIKLKDITLNDTATIRVVGKGKKERKVYAKSELVEKIKACYHSEKYLFETRNHTKLNRHNAKRTIMQLGKKAGYTISPHTLRHSCAMHLKSKGKTPDEIQKYLGHASVSTTLEYYFHGKLESNVMELF